jgi:hypothetical protein
MVEFRIGNGGLKESPPFCFRKVCEAKTLDNPSYLTIPDLGCIIFYKQKEVKNERLSIQTLGRSENY